MTAPGPVPVLCVAGYSGAGKTTLIEALLPRLTARGWRVGVVKHDAHRLTLDTAGKDTARFFDAGAALVCGHDATQLFTRAPTAGPLPLPAVLAGLPRDLDLALVEGHRTAPVDKLVCEHPDERPPIRDRWVLETLPWGDGRPEAAEVLVADWLEAAWQARPLAVATLPAEPGASEVEGVRVPPAPGLPWPLAALVGLLRHDPTRAWLTLVEGEAVADGHAERLRQRRRPGRWALLPERALHGAVWEPQVLPALERAGVTAEADPVRVALDLAGARQVPGRPRGTEVPVSRAGRCRSGQRGTNG